MEQMPIRFADAVCNAHANAIRYAGMDEDMRVELLQRHSGMRYRSITGFACDACKRRAEAIWEQYQLLITGGAK